MANVVHYRRVWQGEAKKRVKSKNFVTAEQRAAGVVDYYLSPQHLAHRKAFFGLVWNKNKGKSGGYVKTKNLFCVCCADDGLVVEATVMDHVIPRNKGGADHVHNYQALCGRCHDAKSAREK